MPASPSASSRPAGSSSDWQHINRYWAIVPPTVGFSDTSQPAARFGQPRLRGPRIVDRLAVARVVRAEGDELEPLVAGLERPRGAWRDADRVQAPHLHDLAGALRAAGPADDHVRLLGRRVAMGERAALPWAQAEVRDAGRLGLQRLARDARLPAVPEPVARRRVLDVGEIEVRERLRHRPSRVDRSSLDDGSRRA